MTTLPQVNKALAVDCPGVKLVKGQGYYYVSSDDDAIHEQICKLYTSSIGVFHISQQSVEQWVRDVKNVLRDSDRFGLDRCPVILSKSY